MLRGQELDKIPEFPRIIKRYLHVSATTDSPDTKLAKVTDHRIKTEPVNNGQLIYPEVQCDGKWQKLILLGRPIQCRCRTLGMFGSGVNLTQQRVGTVRKALDRWLEKCLDANNAKLRKSKEKTESPLKTKEIETNPTVASHVRTREAPNTITRVAGEKLMRDLSV